MQGRGERPVGICKPAVGQQPTQRDGSLEADDAPALRCLTWEGTRHPAGPIWKRCAGKEGRRETSGRSAVQTEREREAEWGKAGVISLVSVAGGCAAFLYLEPRRRTQDGLTNPPVPVPATTTGAKYGKGQEEHGRQIGDPGGRTIMEGWMVGDGGDGTGRVVVVVYTVMVGARQDGRACEPPPFRQP